MTDKLVTRIFVSGALLALGAGAVPGCKSKASASTSAAVSSATTTSATVPLPEIHIPLHPAAAAFPGKLQAEAAHRPTGTPTAEQMFGTLQLKGVPLHEMQQYMGHTWGALYCAGAETDHDVFLSVCEFQDPQAAETGKQTFTKAFSGIRPAYINKSTVLNLRDDAKTPESAAQMKMLAEVFAGL